MYISEGVKPINNCLIRSKLPTGEIILNLLVLHRSYDGYARFIVMQIRPAAVQLIMIYVQHQITHKASPFCWSEKSILNYKPKSSEKPVTKRKICIRIGSFSVLTCFMFVIIGDFTGMLLLLLPWLPGTFGLIR